MNSKKINLLSSIIKYGFVAIGIIACGLVFMGPNAESTVEEIEKFREGGSLSLAINFTMFVMITGVAVILVFFLAQLITNTKKTVYAIIGLLVALVVYLIFWAAGTSDNYETLALTEDVMVEQGTIVSTTAGIYTALIGVIIGFLVWFLSPLMGRMRK